jgi:rhodanese-related sulfurtransferase
MRKALMWTVIVALGGVIAYLLVAPTGGIKVVDTAGVVAAQAKGAQVIDVRTAGEFQLGHIPGAKNVPVDTIASAASGWDRNATYVIYCASGARSAQAVKTLTSMGFKNLDHFSAGFNGWTGKIESGTASTAPTKIATSGKPVMIEFYTDS